MSLGGLRRYTLVIGPRFVVANGYIADEHREKAVQASPEEIKHRSAGASLESHKDTFNYPNMNSPKHTHGECYMSVTAMRDSVPSVFIGSSSPTHSLLTTEQSPGLQNESTHSDKPCYL